MTTRQSLTAALRRLALAACAGAVLGIATRVAMRLVAWQAGVNASFSFGGSFEIVLFGILVGTPLALLYWGCRARFALPRLTGVAAALALFAVLALWPTPSARGALAATPDTPIVTAAIFAAAFLVYGVALDALWRLEQRS
jgi:hypothetical protein